MSDIIASAEPQTRPATPLSEQQLAEIREEHAAYQAGHVPIGFACCSAHPVADRVPALLAEVERLQEHFDKAIAAFNEQSLRVTELEAERHKTNAALDDAVAAIRAKDTRITALETAAGLVAEYRVPTAEKWLSVRREPNGTRWAITQTFGHSPMRAWTGELWISVALATNSELWNYDTAEAALAEASRLAENPAEVAR